MSVFMLDRNHTRYSTEDLATVFACVERLIDWRGIHPSEIDVNLGYWTESNTPASLNYVGELSEGVFVQPASNTYSEWRRAFRTDFVRLLVVSPGVMLDWLNPMALLARAGTEALLPAEVVRSLAVRLVEVGGMSAWHQSNLPQQFQGYRGKELFLQEVVRPARERVAAADLPPVRVLPRIETPPSVRVLSREERIARYKDLYGDGGKLEGPNWAWASGRRYATWKWENRLDAAQTYYERELDARLKYADKLRALGEEPTPYETFPEYLRSLADSIERRQGGK